MGTGKQSSIASALAIAGALGIIIGTSGTPSWGIAPQTAEPQAQGATDNAPLAPGVTRVPVVFSGGYETDPRDRGRPVILIASALGVAPEVFREAFRHVNPARGGDAPEPAQVHANKDALLRALGPYGITNERLDAVSDYYRYPPGRNSRWRTTPAVANALVKDGAVVGYEIVRAGSGYTAAPRVTVPGVSGAQGVAKLAYGKRFETNGSVSAITVASSAAHP